MNLGLIIAPLLEQYLTIAIIYQIKTRILFKTNRQTLRQNRYVVATVYFCKYLS
jgi:hypothetical protein